jgi:putative tricarboxylic transport membrane protein
VKINDAVFGAILVLLGVAVLVAVQAFPRIPGQNVGPGLFPGLIAAGMLACGALLVVSGVRHRDDAPWVASMPWMRSRPHLLAFVATVAVVILYIALANAVGFLILAPVLMFVLLIAYGVRPRAAAVASIVVSLAIWYAFYKLLRVPLPWGVLERFAF